MSNTNDGYLRLIHPETIRDSFGPLDPRTVAAIATFGDSAFYSLSHDDQVRQIDAILTTLRPDRGDVEADDGSDTAAYDSYFRVNRTADSPARVFAAALVTSYRELLVEAGRGTSLSPEEWNNLQAAFRQMTTLL